MANNSINERINSAAVAVFNPSELDASAIDEIGSILQELVYQWREELLRVWPRETGFSYTQWDSYVDGLDIVLQNPVEYAGWVSFKGTKGTREMGTAAEFMIEFAESLIRKSGPQMREIARASAARLSSGESEAGTIRSISTSIDVFGAMVRAFEGRGVRERQRDFFGASAMSAAINSLSAAGGAPITPDESRRLRERTRER